MLIEKRGPWKKTTQAELDIQLTTISVKVVSYKTLLGISQDDIDRIVAANLMNLFVNTARSQFTSFVQGLTKYDDDLRNGNMFQQMNAFPTIPALGTAPAATFGGIWHFIENRRTTWLANPACSEAVGEDMTLLGPIQIFDTDTYKPLLKATVGAGVIHVKTDSTDIEVHNLYAAINGQPLVLIASFVGAKFDYDRTLAVIGQAESVNLQVQGLFKNQPIGKLSDIVMVAYNG